MNISDSILLKTEKWINTFTYKYPGKDIYDFLVSICPDNRMLYLGYIYSWPIDTSICEDDLTKYYESRVPIQLLRDVKKFIKGSLRVYNWKKTPFDTPIPFDLSVIKTLKLEYPYTLNSLWKQYCRNLKKDTILKYKSYKFEVNMEIMAIRFDMIKHIIKKPETDITELFTSLPISIDEDIVIAFNNILNSIGNIEKLYKYYNDEKDEYIILDALCFIINQSK